jgi:hypothetical protein
MLEVRKPDIWIFGHHHVPVGKEINGTRFVGLAELEYMDIEIDWNKDES